MFFVSCPKISLQLMPLLHLREVKISPKSYFQLSTILNLADSFVMFIAKDINIKELDSKRGGIKPSILNLMIDLDRTIEILGT
jgi:hypothetical protein